MVSRERLDKAYAGTQQVYQTHARQFDTDRDKSLYEKACLDQFLAGLPTGGSILDVGCGSGLPIAGYLIEQGFRVTGVDYAPAMIDLARARFGNHRWLVQDMRQLDLEARFDGVVSWNGFFHLTMDEQRSTLPVLAGLVNEGGALLVTVGPEASEVTGTVAGQSVYHASLSETEYRSLLEQAGMREIQFRPQDPQCNRHSILMARRS